MTPQRAFDFLIMHVIDPEDKSHKDMALVFEKLVAKAEPMKPYIDDNDFFICSGCHGAIVGVDDAYCSECGQKLDWSDEK